MTYKNLTSSIIMLSCVLGLGSTSADASRGRSMSLDSGRDAKLKSQDAQAGSDVSTKKTVGVTQPKSEPVKIGTSTIYTQSKKDLKIFVYAGCTDRLATTVDAVQWRAQNSDSIIGKLIGAFRDFGNTQLKQLQSELEKLGCKLTKTIVSPGSLKAAKSPQKVETVPKDTIILAYKTGFFQSAKPAICHMEDDVYLSTVKVPLAKTVTSMATKGQASLSGDRGLTCTTTPLSSSTVDEDADD